MIDPLHPPSPQRAVWTLDVGGSHATAALVETGAGAARVRQTRDSVIDPEASEAALLDAIARPALEFVSTTDGPTGQSDWTVAMPGPFDYDAGVGVFEDVGKFDSLRGVSVRQGLAARLNTDPGRIRFLNDAAAYGIGEWAYGSADRAGRLVCITLGTGVGSAFLDAGTVVDSGPDVPPHGWAHLLSFAGRPLEETVSARAITAAYAERTGRTVAVRTIAGAARDGDGVARSVIDHAMTALGSTIAPWLTAFRADRLIVGGSMAKSWPLLEVPLRRGLQEGGTPAGAVDVRPSSLFAHAPLLGAAFWACHLPCPAPDPRSENP